MLDYDEVKKRFTYDEDEGFLRWRYSVTRVKSGDVAGCINSKGYQRVKVGGKYYYCHRLIWLYVYGRLPDQHIDHVNGNRADNRIVNLREASSAENGRNIKIPKSNTSGHVGVIWDKRINKWCARVKVNYKQIHIGSFINKSDAIVARKFYEKVCGFHSNHGRR